MSDGLDNGELPNAGSRVLVPNHSGSRQPWRSLLEQFCPLCAQTVVELHEASSVAAGPRQALNEAAADWIYGYYKYHRVASNHLQQAINSSSSDQDHVRFQRGQFRGVFARQF